MQGVSKQKLTEAETEHSRDSEGGEGSEVASQGSLM